MKIIKGGHFESWICCEKQRKVVSMNCSQFHKHFTISFCANILSQKKKIQSQTVIREKLCKILAYKKARVKCWWFRHLFFLLSAQLLLRGLEARIEVVAILTMTKRRVEVARRQFEVETKRKREAEVDGGVEAQVNTLYHLRSPEESLLETNKYLYVFCLWVFTFLQILLQL